MWRKIVHASQSVLTIDDTPHAIALGAALGLFIGWTPTVGIQMILVLIIAPFLRANKFPALLGVYISNPYTFLPMYWIDYQVGSAMFHHRLDYGQFREQLSNADWKQSFYLLLSDVALPMWLGGIVLGLVTAIPSYFIVRAILIRRAKPVSDEKLVSTTTHD